MLSGLLLSALLMGLAGMPHCAAMCGVPCTMAWRKGVPLAALAGRCASYAVLGAVAAGSAGVVAQWGRDVAVLRPLWVLAQAAAASLGLWLLIKGRFPAVMEQYGLGAYHRVRAWVSPRIERAQGVFSYPWLWQFLAGLGWGVVPCGLLYGALMVAALAPDALGGMLVMGAFAVPSAAGVWGGSRLLAWRPFRLRASPQAGAATQGAGGVAPLLWIKADRAVLRDGGPRSDAVGLTSSGSGGMPPNGPQERFAQVEEVAWAVRLSGLILFVMAGWGLYTHLLHQWQQWCG